MKLPIKIILTVIGLYLISCIGLYFIQDKLIFFPQKLAKNYTFQFPGNYEELNFTTTDNKLLNGILFKVENSKGLIFYLHGNGGALNSWGNIAELYTNLQYDIFILDYRGYGKSEGSIINEEQLFKDNQLVYNTLKKRYQEQNIIILGYSLGTGLAAKLASENKPKELILQAPYYNFKDIVLSKSVFIPTFILKYKFLTNQYLAKCNMPITIFHGTEDNVSYYGSSTKLKKDYPKINLITLKNQGHNNISAHPKYKSALQKILN